MLLELQIKFSITSSPFYSLINSVFKKNDDSKVIHTRMECCTTGVCVQMLAKAESRETSIYFQMKRTSILITWDSSALMYEGMFELRLFFYHFKFQTMIMMGPFLLIRFVCIDILILIVTFRKQRRWKVPQSYLPLIILTSKRLSIIKNQWYRNDDRKINYLLLF